MKQRKLGSKTPETYIKSTIIAALFIGAAILFSACENDLKTIKAFSSPKDLPILYAENYKSTYIDSGQVRNYLEAPVLQQFESDGNPFIEFPKGVILDKFDGQKRILSSITANYAKQYTKEKKWEAKNNVIAVNNEGDTLKTEHLIWEESTGKIYSERYVKFVHDDKIIYGNGFESDQNMENWRIKDVEGIIYINVEENTEPEPSANKPQIPVPNEHNKQKPIVNVKKPISIQK